jgi:hypothetical protein
LQRQQGHDIGLFDHLGFSNPLSTEHHVHWHGTAGVVRQVDIFESEKARALQLLEPLSCLGWRIDEEYSSGFAR